MRRRTINSSAMVSFVLAKTEREGKDVLRWGDELPPKAESLWQSLVTWLMLLAGVAIAVLMAVAFVEN